MGQNHGSTPAENTGALCDVSPGCDLWKTNATTAYVSLTKDDAGKRSAVKVACCAWRGVDGEGRSSYLASHLPDYDTRIVSTRKVHSRHRDYPGHRQEYSTQVFASPRTGRHAPSATEPSIQAGSVQRAGQAVDQRGSLLQL